MARIHRAIALLFVAGTAVGASPNPFADPDFGKRHVGMFDGSYAKCLLDRLPGVANDLAAQQIANGCLREYPDGGNTVEHGNTAFGYSTAAECVIKKARDTASRQAAQMIAYACYHRYPHTP